MSPASLGIVTFRRRPAGVDDEAVLERINADLAERIEQGGEVFISTGRVRGRYVLRLCILNHSTSQAEVDRALELAETLEVDVEPRRRPRRTELPRVEAGWLGRSTLDLEGLRSIPLFASLDDEQASRPAVGARAHAAAGEPIIEQWQVSRDLYVVLDGRGRRSRPTRDAGISGPATSSARSPRSTGAQASAGRARRPSSRGSRPGCSPSTGCSSTS